jgi:FkbM family methyltransferase
MMVNFLKIFQKLDDIIYYLFSNRCNEEKFLKNFFKKKNLVIIDAGGNLGAYIDLLEKNFFIRKGFIFEPSRECEIYLKKHYNKKYTIINQALSNIHKKKIFYENEVLSQSSLIQKNNAFNKNFKIKKSYTIQCTTIDNFYKKNKLNNIFDILKIDCEGEDYNVLKGSKNLLINKRIKLIKIEIENNSKLIKIINFLKKYDYNLVTITKNKFYEDKLIFIDAYFSSKKFL